MSLSSDDSRVIIFDTIMHAGTLSSGVSINLHTNLRNAEGLEGMGVDVTDSPAASPWAYVKLLVKRQRRDPAAMSA